MFVAKKKVAHIHFKLRRSGMSGETCRPHGTQNDTVILHGYKHAAPPELTSPVRQASPLKSTTLGVGVKTVDLSV